MDDDDDDERPFAVNETSRRRPPTSNWIWEIPSCVASSRTVPTPLDPWMGMASSIRVCVSPLMLEEEEDCEKGVPSWIGSPIH